MCAMRGAAEKVFQGSAAAACTVGGRRAGVEVAGGIAMVSGAATVAIHVVTRGDSSAASFFFLFLKCCSLWLTKTKNTLKSLLFPLEAGGGQAATASFWGLGERNYFSRKRKKKLFARGIMNSLPQGRQGLPSCVILPDGTNDQLPMGPSCTRRWMRRRRRWWQVLL